MEVIDRINMAIEIKSDKCKLLTADNVHMVIEKYDMEENFMPRSEVSIKRNIALKVRSI